MGSAVPLRLGREGGVCIQMLFILFPARNEIIQHGAEYMSKVLLFISHSQHEKLAVQATMYYLDVDSYLVLV